MKMRLISWLLAVASLVTLTAAPVHAQGLSGGYTYWVPPGACSGTSTTPTVTPIAVDGASNTPVVKVSDAGAGATQHTITFTCNINPPSWVVTAAGLGITITDATFAYSPQTTITTTQTSSLSSGVYNSATVFASITYPTAAVNETASTITPVRADSGTLTIAPLTSQFNGTTQTAGAYFTIKFTPAAGTLVWKSDGRNLLMQVAFVTTSGLTTVVTTPGVLIHAISQ